MAITIPNEYGYVLLAATSTFFVNMYHMSLTSKARKKAAIAYPTAYASTELADKDPNAFAFNCAQRAHANFTESLTPALGALLIAGLQFPTYAAGLGAAWAIGRTAYAAGYTSSSGPKGRLAGSVIGSLSDITLKFMAAYASYKIIVS